MFHDIFRRWRQQPEFRASMERRYRDLVRSRHGAWPEPPYLQRALSPDNGDREPMVMIRGAPSSTPAAANSAQREVLPDERSSPSSPWVPTARPCREICGKTAGCRKAWYFRRKRAISRPRRLMTRRCRVRMMQSIRIIRETTDGLFATDVIEGIGGLGGDGRRGRARSSRAPSRPNLPTNLPITCRIRTP